MSKPPLSYSQLLRLDYEEAERLQDTLLRRRQDNAIGDTVLMVEHPHTYTLGTRAKEEDVLLSRAELAERGIAVFRSDRGGEVTYHGPGQLVVYPILRLADNGLTVLSYVRLLEAVIKLTAADHGIDAICMAGRPGVFTKHNGELKKLAAIGVRVGRGVAKHGFALNVSTDLSYFRHIVPCGLPGLPGESLAARSGHRVELDEVRRRAAAHLAERLGRQAVEVVV